MEEKRTRIRKVRKRRKCKLNILEVRTCLELPDSCTIYRVYHTHTHRSTLALLVKGYLLAWSELRL